jgi:hypothetical protein
MGERKTPKPFIAACNQFKYLDVLAETEKKSMELEENRIKPGLALDTDKAGKTETKKEKETEVENGKNQKPVSTTETIEAGKNMTDLSVIKAAILKMMNEVDEDGQRMNMGELGSRLVKRYPDFDVRNYGDTKLSKFLKKFDFLEISSDGSSMWVRLHADKENKIIVKAQEGKTTPVRRRRRTKKK